DRRAEIKQSATRRRAGDWLKAEFTKLGYTPQSMTFSEVIEGKQYTDLENIYVEKRGTKHPDEIVVAMAHYDVTDTTLEGAMDDASGVAVVLELARIFSKENSDRTLLFLLTDSEEFGAFWGARAFAKNFDRADKIVAAENFDFVGPDHQTRILTLCSGLKNGYTPLWLREIALDSVRSVGGVKAIDFDNIVEFIERAVQIPPADHGAFLAEGIPAFNYVGQTDHFSNEMARYHHTPGDVAEIMRPESFISYGRAAERVMRTIDTLVRIPEDFRNNSYWKISSHLYVDGWVVTLLHILGFIPFLAYCISKFQTTLYTRKREMLLVVLKNETKNIGILLASLLLGYGIMRLLPSLSIVTQYEVFPATQKSVILSNPNLMAILLVVGSILGVYLVFKRTFQTPEDLLEHSEIRHALHAVFLALIIFLAFLKNSYLAVLLLLPPAYFWVIIRTRKKAEDRIFNFLLLLGGAITFITTAVVLTTIFHIGVIYWYLFLSATYGLISAYTVVLFFMVLTVMIRLFRSFVM
ncbi:MAG: M28 family peptidase, partial [Bdellovibrionota bacterium]